MLKTLLYSFIAGILGTTVGGLISVIFGNKKRFNTNIVLGAASGFMLAISCFELIPDAIVESGIGYTVLGIAIGIIVLAVLDIVSKHQHAAHAIDCHGDAECEHRTNNARMGIMIVLAIALHNFPEGMAIGSQEVIGSSLAMTILIALHNIPEGMAMATPLMVAKTKRYKIILYIIASGVPTILGALLGYYLGGLNELVNALCLSTAAGAMLYVVIFEMFRECYKEEKHINYVAAANIVGLVIGLVAIILLG